MSDFQYSGLFRRRVMGVLAILMLAGPLFIGPLASAVGQDDGKISKKAPAFDFHCEKRHCQFWLTDPTLMLRSGLQLQWEFGDGEVSTALAPLHLYERDGRFDPVLTVFDQHGERILASSATVFLGFAQETVVNEFGVVFNGGLGALAGFSVAGLGDFNANGLSDLVIGSPAFFAGGGRGQAYVVFGREIDPGTSFELQNLDGSDGFVFTAGDSNLDLNSIGFSTAGTGSIATGVSRTALIGAPGSIGAQGFAGEGNVAVLYGSGDGFPAQLQQPDLDGSNGFIMRGILDEAFGFSVASAGDFIGNGFQDVVIGAPQGPVIAGDAGTQNLERGKVFVLFGRAAGFPAFFDVANMTVNDGFVLEGEFNQDMAGWSVDGIGDFNGNGASDIVIGAPFHQETQIFLDPVAPSPDDSIFEGISPEGVAAPTGAAYVIFGGQNLAAQGLGRLDDDLLNGVDGFAIRTGSDDRIGLSVAGVGDLSSNGSGDLAVSAPFAPHPETFVSGAAYVLFGGQGAGAFGSEFDPSTGLNGTNGFAVTGLFRGADGEFQGDRTISLASAGDVNGNGFNDLIIGGPGFNSGSGAAYVIFGRGGSFPAVIDVTNLDPENGFMIVPNEPGLTFGRSVAGLGDFDGDGVDDIALGEPGNSDTTSFAWVIPGQIGASEPLINGGAGIADQIAPFPSVLDIDFEISDTIDPPEELIVQAFSGNPDFLPDDALTLSGEGGIRTLSIDTSQAAPGDVPIFVLVTNSSDLTGEAGFLLEIAPQPPVINDGAGIADQTVFAGQSLEFSFTVSDVQDDPADLQVTAISATPDLIPQEGITITEAGDERILELQTLPNNAGTGQIIIEATNSFGLSTVEEVAVQIQDTPFPQINGSDGIPDQSIEYTGELVIDFVVSDPLEPPEALTVQAFSGNPALLPNDALSLAGEGANRTLAIDTSLGFPGSLPIQVLVTNTEGLTGEAEFMLNIIAQPPVINDGDGIPEQRLFAGQVLELDFTVSDLQDDPGDLLVTATSLTADLIPPENISLGGVGENRTLHVQTIFGEGGVGQVIIQATNSFDLTTSEEVIIVIDDTPNPVINDGAGIEDQTLTAGESLAIDFEVADPEFSSDAIELSAMSGNEGVLPSGQLTIQGDGATRTLLIQTFAGNIGSTPITIEARNPVDGTDEVTFGLTIIAAPPSVNDGEPIDDAEIQAGDTLMVDFTVSDPLDPVEVLEISVESSNTELVPLDAITVAGTGNERTLLIETQPGTQGESLITVSVTNTNGEVDVREFLVQVFLLPTTLDLSVDAFALPGFPDLLVRLSAANLGEESAFEVLLASDIPEPFEAIGVFTEAQACVIDDGAMSCDMDALPAWECSLFEGTLVCALESLLAAHEAAVVLRIQGSGQAELSALLDALNASEVATEIELDF